MRVPSVSRTVVAPVPRSHWTSWPSPAPPAATSSPGATATTPDDPVVPWRYCTSRGLRTSVVNEHVGGLLVVGHCAEAATARSRARSPSASETSLADAASRRDAASSACSVARSCCRFASWLALIAQMRSPPIAIDTAARAPKPMPSRRFRSRVRRRWVRSSGVRSTISATSRVHSWVATVGTEALVDVRRRSAARGTSPSTSP